MSEIKIEHCEQCQSHKTIALKESQLLYCPLCLKEWGRVEYPESLFNTCPVCGCRQFYLTKDFNRFVGCLIVLAAILLVPKTFGLSLPVLALIDFVLYKRAKTCINCYRCGTEFHDFKTEKPFKPFMHHIGLKYDKYR